jgi:uncharacterized protein (TIGR02145 family)
MKTNLFRNIVKTRHATSLLVLLLVLLLAFAGCKKDDPAPEPEPTPILTVSPEVIDTTAVAGTYAIAVTSNTTWTVNSSATWSTPDNASGTNNGTVTVSVNENLSTEAQRSATVTFAAGTLTRTVAITQAAALPGTPPQAASTRTWTFGEQTWSDAIRIPECNNPDFTQDWSNPQCSSHSEDGNTWFYYNWIYVNANKETMCPDPWRVPTQEDFTSLVDDAQVSAADLGEAWGFGGYEEGSDSPSHTTTVGQYWSLTDENGWASYVLVYASVSDYIDGTWSSVNQNSGLQVRCVK